MKEHERAAIEKAEKLTAELEKSPMLRALRAEEAAEILAKRTEAAEKITALTRELETHGALRAEIDSMVERLADMDRKRGEFLGAISGKRQFLMQKRGGIESAIRHEEQILSSCYDPKIYETIQFFRDKLEWLRSPGRISRNSVSAERNVFTESVTVTQETNLPAIKQALGYCQAAIQELELMKLSPALDLQKIEAMKKAIPDISVYSENTGERAMEGRKGRSFASYFPSADQTDWQVSKLLEKAGKILAPKRTARA